MMMESHQHTIKEKERKNIEACNIECNFSIKTNALRLVVIEKCRVQVTSLTRGSEK